MKPLFIALLPIFLLLYFRTTATAPLYGTLTGTVTGTGDKALADAMIRLAPGTCGALCRADGQFSLTRLIPGSYSASIFCAGYKPVRVQFTIVADSTTDIQVSLTLLSVLPVIAAQNNRATTFCDEVKASKTSDTTRKQYGILTGEITDENGDPIIGASVRIVGSERGAYTKPGGAYGKPNGAYKVIKLEPGCCTVQVTAVGFQRAEKEVIITAGETTNLSLSLAQDNHVIIYENFCCPMNQLQPNHSQIGTIRVITGDQLYHSP